MAVDTKRVTVYLEGETHRKLKIAAVEAGDSVSELVNRAVLMLLEQEGGAGLAEESGMAERGGEFVAPTQTLAVDEELLREAMRIGGHKSQKAAITRALAEYIRRMQQMKILALFGKIDIDPAYEYKAQRKRK
ncbi:MAG: type II toxin-antitoxin system VapB family antitoxin [Bacteroidota bacterium]